MTSTADCNNNKRKWMMSTRPLFVFKSATRFVPHLSRPGDITFHVSPPNKRRRRNKNGAFARRPDPDMQVCHLGKHNQNADHDEDVMIQTIQETWNKYAAGVIDTVTRLKKITLAMAIVNHDNDDDDDVKSQTNDDDVKGKGKDNADKSDGAFLWIDVLITLLKDLSVMDDKGKSRHALMMKINDVFITEERNAQDCKQPTVFDRMRHALHQYTILFDQHDQRKLKLFLAWSNRVDCVNIVLSQIETCVGIFVSNELRQGLKSI